MPPKAAEVPAASLAQRPQTPNDLAMSKTEALLADTTCTETKWRQRQHDSTREGAKTRLHATLGRINIEACQRLIEELDKAVETALLTSRGDAAPTPPPTGKDSKKGAPKDAAPPKPPAEVQEVLDVLLKFYRFDGRPAPQPAAEERVSKPARGNPAMALRQGTAASGRSTPATTRGNTPIDGRRPPRPSQSPQNSSPANAPAAPPPDPAVDELVAVVREKVRTGWTELVEPGEDVYSCTKALAVTSNIALAVVGLEELPAPVAFRSPGLPPLKGIDKALWAKLMQLRDQRLLVCDAVRALEKEQVPLSNRGTTLLTINDLAAYALNACQRGRKQLEGTLQQQEQVRQQETSQWLEEQKGGAAAKK
eukprot:TRINITY_DN28161_c0_g1_i1.p1 TRINITY_DN28161_c0_g1~~TRINITY_DN28161_c0_g1_i1.p1  ORF type:complete len:391 (+),score=134.31 TRINITY_DN28161_c0_g1_i1:76-1173(+)